MTEPFKMKSRKTMRDTNIVPKPKVVDVTGLKLFVPPGKELHAFFKKGGKSNP